MISRPLGVPQPEQPGGDGWGFTAGAEKIPVEEREKITFHHRSCFIYFIEDKVSADRFATLVKLS